LSLTEFCFGLCSLYKPAIKANLISRVAVIGVVFIAVAYEFLFKSIIFDSLGYGRKVLSIKNFKDVRCEKVTELGLEGCEDMWLHEPTGFIFMACSDSQSRSKWLPAFVIFLSDNTL
jgi:arylesterase/paraoxonase